MRNWAEGWAESSGVLSIHTLMVYKNPIPSAVSRPLPMFGGAGGAVAVLYLVSPNRT
ncbi:hypothetical protein TRIP_B350029 [uncultured Desulfatiglans sp.]|nr:hypothetical protein TRIP_B350029 [uncultured Desulfatiglans sp.]